MLMFFSDQIQILKFRCQTYRQGVSIFAAAIVLVVFSLPVVARSLQCAALFSESSSKVQTGNSRLVPFRESPDDVAKVTPRSHPGIWLNWVKAGLVPEKIQSLSGPIQLAKMSWAKFQEKCFLTAAFLSSYYPASVYPTIYVLVRDPLPLAYAMRLVEPNSSRIKFLAVSRLSKDDPLLPDYLSQEGLNPSTLEKMKRKGQRVVLLDSGYNHSLGKHIRQKFPKELQDIIELQLNNSNDSNVPQTQSFSDHDLNSTLMMAVAPKSTGRVASYSLDAGTGRLVPMALENADPGDAYSHSANSETTRLQEDLAAYIQNSEIKLKVEIISRLVQKANLLHGQNDRPALIKLLAEFRADQMSPIDERTRIALVLDWIGANAQNPIQRGLVFNIKLREMGLSSNRLFKEFDLSVPSSNLQGFLKANSKLRDITYPEQLIPIENLLQAKDYKALLEIFTKVGDYDVENKIEAAVEELLEQNPAEFTASLAIPLLEIVHKQGKKKSDLSGYNLRKLFYQKFMDN